jgi:uncharacterized protein (TIGR00255 family)
MTGFARVRKGFASGEIVVSLKSVNHRGLDLHFHMPPEMDALENDLRTLIKARVARGHLQIHVAVVSTAETGSAPLNRALLDTYVCAFREAATLYGIRGEPDLNAALRLPGMLAGAPAAEELSGEISQAVREAAAEAVTLLNSCREREGAVTVQDIQQRCQTITTQVDRIEEIRTGAIPAFQKRLREKLADLLEPASIEPQRLAQEAALLADRSDISEELVRLRTHTEQLQQMLRVGGEIGKRMDFLLQEMNRESNTMLSKTGGLGELGLTITELALAAKSEIDKIREQSLNLE